MTVRPFVALVAVSLVMVACSGSDAGDPTTTSASSTTRLDAGNGVTALGDAYGAVLWEGRPEDPAPYDFTEASARCVGRSFVGALAEQVGYETLADAGVTPEALGEQPDLLASFITNDDFDWFLFDAFDECTDFMEQIGAPATRGLGWSEQSVACFWDELLAEEANRRAVAWGIFTANDLSAALFDVIGPDTLLDVWFVCLSDEELTGWLVALVDPDIGLREESLRCLMGGLIAELPSREALREAFRTDDDIQAMLQTLQSNPEMTESVDELMNSCFDDEERTKLDVTEGPP